MALWLPVLEPPPSTSDSRTSTVSRECSSLVTRTARAQWSKVQPSMRTPEPRVPTPLTPEEIAAARSDTPGCRPELIHLNHAGSSLPPQIVLDTQLDHLRLEATIGGYEAAAATAAERAAVYDSIARLIRADPSEIARCEHATAAWNAAFWSIPMEPGRRILVEITLPNAAPLEAIGRVAWTKRVMTPHERNREAGVGIEFLGGVAEHFSALQEFIDRHAEA